MVSVSEVVGAVVLAAGKSSRMGRPKMVLPWAGKTVIGQVVSILISAKVQPVVVVTGGAETEVKEALSLYPVETVTNPLYASSEMLESLKLGIKALGSRSQSALVCLGDQPQIEKEVVEQVLLASRKRPGCLIVPSYHVRRGHPWILPGNLWEEVLALKENENLRSFLNRHQDTIVYVEVETNSILKDLDTPEEYAAEAPPG